MNGNLFRRRDDGKKFLLTATEEYEEDGTVNNDWSVCLSVCLSVLCLGLIACFFVIIAWLE